MSNLSTLCASPGTVPAPTWSGRLCVSFSSVSEGTFPRLLTLPLVEAQADLHARRTPSSRSKLGGSPAHAYERHAAHPRVPS